jgi:hypothetical protein
MATFLDRVTVPGRDLHKIREWRDLKQTYSIFWVANDRTFARYGVKGAYRAYRIEGDKYVQLPSAKNDKAVAEPTFEDAMHHVVKNWRMMTGLKAKHWEPSPKKKRIEDK